MRPPSSARPHSSIRSGRTSQRTQAKNHTRMAGRHAPPVFPSVLLHSRLQSRAALVRNFRIGKEIPSHDRISHAPQAVHPPSSARSARTSRRTQANNHTRMTGRHAPPVFPPVFSAQPPVKPRRASLHAGKKSSRCANEAGRCAFLPAPWRTKPMRRPRAAGSAVSWRWAWGAAPAHRAQRRADQTRSAVIPR